MNEFTVGPERSAHYIPINLPYQLKKQLARFILNYKNYLIYFFNSKLNSNTVSLLNTSIIVFHKRINFDLCRLDPYKVG